MTPLATDSILHSESRCGYENVYAGAFPRAQETGGVAVSGVVWSALVTVV